MIHRYTADELENMPTLSKAQADDLKIDTIFNDVPTRVWLCRCGVDDGMPYDNSITIEQYIDDRWVEIEVYEG